MKNIFKISTVLLALIFFFTAVFRINAQEQQAATGYYDKLDSLEDVMVEYHKYINNTFNDYTKKMLAAIEKNPDDPNGKALETPEQCLKNPQNYSTYCVAVNLLGDHKNPEAKGYLNYKLALENRQNKVFDSAKERDAWNKWIEVTTCLGLPDSVCSRKEKQELSRDAQAIYQSQQIMIRSARLEAIDREILTAKTALDKTLAAYDQLRIAWPMHKQYQRIFDGLVTYRDKLSQLREQTDQFPSAFVDVTTLKCL
jgi:hypothetical protein